MNPFSSVLITGASSGIGAALASHYAAEGVTLHLGARSADKLASVARDCEAKGATVRTETIDVTDRDAMANWVHAADRAAPLALVVANAGVSASTGADRETAEHIRQNFAVNVDGVVNTVLPALEVMEPRGKGQIGVMSSVMGFRGLPSSASYSGAKAAARTFAEGLRGSYANRGIGISTIIPAMVKTPMTDALKFNRGAMPVDKAAAIIARGLLANKPRIGFSRGMYFLFWLMGALPTFLTDRIFRAKA